MVKATPKITFESEQAESQQAEPEQAKPSEKKKLPDNFFNRQRTMTVVARGSKRRHKFFSHELIQIMSHLKGGPKIEASPHPSEQIKKRCDKSSSENYMFFEVKKNFQFLWIGKSPEGPCAYLRVVDYLPLDKNKFTGNFMLASRSLFSFSEEFDIKPEYVLLKDLLVDSLNVPKNFPRTYNYLEKVISFELISGLIYGRMFQITENRSLNEKVELTEAGPRMTLQLVKICSGIVGGEVLYENPDYKEPEQVLIDKKESKRARKENKAEEENNCEVKWENVDDNEGEGHQINEEFANEDDGFEEESNE